MMSRIIVLSLLWGHTASFLPKAVNARRPSSSPPVRDNDAVRMSFDDDYFGPPGLSSLSVSELKRLLAERGVDFRDCLEKRDLIERLENSDARSSVPVDMPLSLTQEETRMIDTFKRVSPSVAYITTIVQPRAFALQGTEVPSGAGSGFLWDHQGHIVTNFHVIAEGQRGVPKRVMVKLEGMPEALPAVVVGYEAEKDIAVLRIPNQFLPEPIDVGTSNDLQVGQKAFAIGNPFGLDYTLTTGVVSALGREVQGYAGRPIKGCIQTDASINPGNSGGPLLDSRGRLIGVNTAIFSPNGGMGGNIGIGFAIPVDVVRRVVNQIIRFGKVVRPSLGINVVEDRILRSIEAQARRRLEGVLVAETIPGSPAAAAGLRPSTFRGDGTLVLGDLITNINGQPVRQVEDLLSAVEERNEGEMVVLRVLRECEPDRAEMLRVQLVPRDSLQNNTPSKGRGNQSNVVNGGRSWQ